MRDHVKNKKFHRIAGGFAAFIALLLSLTTFSQWDYAGVLKLVSIATIYNAVFVYFQLTNVSEKRKNQMILIGNFMLFNLFLIYTKGFDNNTYLPVFVFAVGIVTQFYGLKWGVSTLLVCMFLSFQKILDSIFTWDFLSIHLAIYMGAFFIGAVIHHKFYLEIKIDTKENQEDFIEEAMDQLTPVPVYNQGVRAVEPSTPNTQTPISGALDRLTGLLSYNAFYKKFGQIAHATLSANEKFFLLIIDIDHFKGINQHYGYAIGDKILIKIGKIIKTSVEGYGIAGRHGGDEFIVVLHEEDYEKASDWAEALIMKIESELAHIEGLENQSLVISLSSVMVCYPETSNDIHNLVSIADFKLNKERGLVRYLKGS